MLSKYINIAFVLMPLLLQNSAFGQESKLDYSKEINGLYHYYHLGNLKEHYLFIVQADSFLFIDTKRNDTFYYRAKWTATDVLTTSYLSGTGTVKKGEIKKLKHEDVLYKFVGSTEDYILLQAYRGKVSTKAVQDDTIWLAEKSERVINKQFQRVYNMQEVQEGHFSDTSNYALVYIYRPGKITNSLAGVPILFNGEQIVVAQNKRGYVFKVFKEGQLSVMSKLFADKSIVNLKIEKGKTYYVKAMIHWTLASKYLYNFNLEMAQMDNTKGEAEFNEVKFSKK